MLSQFLFLLCIHFFVRLLCLGIVSSTNGGSKTQAQIYWNFPAYSCRNVFDPKNYGILTNRNQSFYGEYVVVFYEHKFGLYPRIMVDKENSSKILEIINGGLPQNISLKDHLSKVKRDVLNAIPNKDFSGLAIIDYEEWRPLYDANWSSKSIYRNMSIIDAKRKYPNISRKAIELKAQKDFDLSAKKFLLETIKLCKKLRPKAKWGFYDYPSCNYDAGHQGETECSKKYQSINERLLWLYKEVVALYPQIYLYKKSKDRLITQNYVHAKAMEAEWINIISKRSIPLYFYSKIEYSPYVNKSGANKFYEKDDLCDTIGYPLNIGADGIVLWSTSTQMKERCEVIKNYLDETLGPYLDHFNKKITRCKKRLCHNHGRCILHDRLPKAGCFPKMSRYMCMCDHGYTGENCELKM